MRVPNEGSEPDMRSVPGDLSEPNDERVPTGLSEPETQRVQVACNASGSDGNCNDWFLDPIPVVNPDGSTSPGQTRARLNYGSGAPFNNEGDFYLTFHIHVTRP